MNQIAVHVGLRRHEKNRRRRPRPFEVAHWESFTGMLYRTGSFENLDDPP